jgi:hypothetical protein
LTRSDQEPVGSSLDRAKILGNKCGQVVLGTAGCKPSKGVVRRQQPGVNRFTKT